MVPELAALDAATQQSDVYKPAKNTPEQHQREQQMFGSTGQHANNNLGLTPAQLVTKRTTRRGRGQENVLALSDRKLIRKKLTPEDRAKRAKVRRQKACLLCRSAGAGVSF